MNPIILLTAIVWLHGAGNHVEAKIEPDMKTCMADAKLFLSEAPVDLFSLMPWTRERRSTKCEVRYPDDGRSI